MAPPEAGVRVMVTVLEGSPVPTSVGLVLLVRLSVAEVPVSLAASCVRAIVAVGAVWSSVNAPVAVVVLPAASVETTSGATLPSARPAAGIVTDVGVAALVSSDQLPVASVVAV